MTRALLFSLALAATLLPGYVDADELTAIIQTDLQTLGYEPGSTDGEMTVQTAVAVSKFQAENGLEVTGEVSPQLAGVVKAAISKQGQAASAVQPAPASNAAAQQAQAAQLAAAMQAAQAQGAAMDPAMLQAMQAQAAQAQGAQAQAAQQACLQQKIAAAQEAKESAQRRRGFGSLVRGLSRLGGNDVVASVAEATADIANANAAINDLESAARDLGLTEADVEDCRNPQ